MTCRGKFSSLRGYPAYLALLMISICGFPLLFLFFFVSLRIPFYVVERGRQALFSAGTAPAQTCHPSTSWYRIYSSGRECERQTKKRRKWQHNSWCYYMDGVFIRNPAKHNFLGTKSPSLSNTMDEQAFRHWDTLALAFVNGLEARLFPHPTKHLVLFFSYCFSISWGWGRTYSTTIF